MERLKQLLEFIKIRKKLVGFFTIIVLVILIVTLNKVYHYSETSEFCASCHEMKIHYDSFKASKHHNEHVENCHACHVGPGLKGYAHAKLSDGTHDSMMHSFQAFTDGAFIEIAEDSLEILNGNCVRCQSEGFTKDKSHIEFVQKSNKHGTHGETPEKLACTDCHLGVVHPHMPGDLFKAYAARKIKPYGTYGETDCLACHKIATPDAKAYDACEKCHIGGPDHSRLDTGPNSLFGKVQKLRSQGLITKELVTCQSCHGPNKSHNFSRSFIPPNLDVLLFGGTGLVKLPTSHQ